MTDSLKSKQIYLEFIGCLINQSNIDINKRGINGKTPLHCAIELDEISLVDLLLSKKDINPLATDDNNKSALDYAKNDGILQALINHKYGSEEDSLLHLAAILNEENAVRFLLKNGVDANVQNALLHTPLHLAAGMGHEKVVEILIKEGKTDKDVLDIRNHNKRGINGKTPLHCAIELDEISLVDLLLSKKDINPLATDDNNKSALDYAKNDGILQALINHKYGSEEDSLLHLAAILNEENAVRFLLKNGVDANVQNALLHTPLHLAAGMGHEKVVEILIKEGKTDKDVLDIRNHTPLHYAVNNKKLRVVKLLSNLGADVNRIGSGKSAMRLSSLHIAVNNTNYDERDLCLDIVRCLINAPNAEINLQDYEKKTPLHYAERVKNVEVLLARKDIDPLMKDDDGKTPFCYAREENKSEVVEILIKNKYGPDKDNILHLAAKKGYVELINSILDEGVEVDTLNERGESAIYLAAKNGHLNAVKLLLKKGADATDIFQHAMITNNEKLIKLLGRKRDIVLFGKNDNFPTFHMLSNKYLEERKIADSRIKKYNHVTYISVAVCAIALITIYPQMIVAIVVGVFALIVAIVMNNLTQKYIEEELQKKMSIELESERESQTTSSNVEIQSEEEEDFVDHKIEEPTLSRASNEQSITL